MKNLGVGVIILTLLMASAPNSFADKIKIGFSIKESEFKKLAKKQGLDLDGKDNSMGRTENLGNVFNVITYKSATPEQLEIIKDCAFKAARK